MTGAYPVSRYRTALTQPSKHFLIAAAVRKGLSRSAMYATLARARTEQT